MNMFFIVRKAKELKVAYAEVLKTALSYEHVHKVLSKSGKRNRIYKPLITWIIWLAQTLAPDHSCRNALASARSAGLVSKKSSVYTGAYCQARDRLQEKALRTIAVGLGRRLSKSETVQERWHSRRVIVADGTSVSLADTPANQAVYPQPKTQAVGCGFPIMYLEAFMSLSSGAVLDFETGSGNGNELNLYRQAWHLLRPDDIILGDGLYSAYVDIALRRKRGIDTVARLGKRKTDFHKGTIIGVDDHLVEWDRPKGLPAGVKSRSIPEKMLVRELRFRIEVPGFRPETVTIVTTLLDAEVSPKEDIADLFFRRWQIELRFRDIKTMLNMDTLRTKTPERARKELWMYLTAYNLLRTVMKASALKAVECITRISFQGCRQRLLAEATREHTARQFSRLYQGLLNDIAHDLIPERPFRIEPRAIKRRKKQYDFLNQPRAILRQRLIKKGA